MAILGDIQQIDVTFTTTKSMISVYFSADPNTFRIFFTVSGYFSFTFFVTIYDSIRIMKFKDRKKLLFKATKLTFTSFPTGD